MDTKVVTAILAEIADLLEAGHEEMSAILVRNALAGPPKDLDAFLASNELWGGSGSIADQSLGGRSQERKDLERLLIALGKVQLRDGGANVRTRGWVSAFEKWRETGV